MIPLKEGYKSSIAKKFVMAITGLAMVVFVITHLTGNLILLAGAEPFNRYAKGLHDLGPLLWLMELGLLAFFAWHIVTGVRLALRAYRARGTKRYEGGERTKGGPSYKSIASNNMVITGSVLGLFIVLHVLQMKYGLLSPTPVREAVVDLDGSQATNLYVRVVETFQSPFWVAIYVVVMGFLALHLRHGFWSAFQSLGALNPRLEKPMTMLGLVVAALLTLGFIALPIVLYARHHDDDIDRLLIIEQEDPAGVDEAVVVPVEERGEVEGDETVPPPAEDR